MLERGHRVGLAAEPFAGAPTRGVRHAHHLDGDIAAQLGVARAKHGGHRAVAKRTQDFIASEGGADPGRRKRPA